MYLLDNVIMCLQKSRSSAVFLLLVLALYPGSASADWWKQGSTSSAVGYVKYDSIKRLTKNGFARVQILALFDYKEADVYEGKEHLSVTHLLEFQCKLEMMRGLGSVYHSKSMGEGDVVHIDAKVDAWIILPPKSLLWKIMEGTCMRKVLLDMHDAEVALDEALK